MKIAVVFGLALVLSSLGNANDISPPAIERAIEKAASLFPNSYNDDGSTSFVGPIQKVLLEIRFAKPKDIRAAFVALEEHGNEIYEGGEKRYMAADLLLLLVFDISGLRKRPSQDEWRPFIEPLFTESTKGNWTWPWVFHGKGAVLHNFLAAPIAGGAGMRLTQLFDKFQRSVPLRKF